MEAFYKISVNLVPPLEHKIYTCFDKWGNQYSAKYNKIGDYWYPQYSGEWKRLTTNKTVKIRSNVINEVVEYNIITHYLIDFDLSDFMRMLPRYYNQGLSKEEAILRYLTH